MIVEVPWHCLFYLHSADNSVYVRALKDEKLMLEHILRRQHYSEYNNTSIL